MRHSKHGFTLIEMAVVLTMIGLIAGAMVAGKSIIRTSHMQTMLGEYDGYLKGVSEFQDRYHALPGDMLGTVDNPESIWGADAGCPNTASNTIPKIATCNGDGSGSIGSSDFAGTVSNSREWFRAWQQLSNAGLLGKRYTGVPGPGGDKEAVIGVNVPNSVLMGAGWTIMYYLSNSDGDMWGDKYGHIMTVGGNRPNSYTNMPIFSAEEALSIDQKIDDGKPGRGFVRTWRTSVHPVCTANDSSQDGQTYNTSNKSGNACSLVFLMGF